MPKKNQYLVFLIPYYSRYDLIYNKHFNNKSDNKNLINITKKNCL